MAWPRISSARPLKGEMRRRRFVASADSLQVVRGAVRIRTGPAVTAASGEVLEVVGAEVISWPRRVQNGLYVGVNSPGIPLKVQTKLRAAR
jgi:hypothetical protein